MTLRLPFTTPEHLPPAAAAVREVRAAHGVVALPTETYYGLAVDPGDVEAVARVFAVKGRGAGKALLVVAASLEQLEALVVVPGRLRPLLTAVWPAPLTVVLPLRRALAASEGTLAVRVPDHPLLCALLARVGPLTATSANRSGSAPAATADAVERDLGGGVDLLLDGGATPGGLPSTLLDASGDELRLLRRGGWEPPAGWHVKAG